MGVKAGYKTNFRTHFQLHAAADWQVSITDFKSTPGDINWTWPPVLVNQWIVSRYQKGFFLRSVIQAWGGPAGFWNMVKTTTFHSCLLQSGSQHYQQKGNTVWKTIRWTLKIVLDSRGGISILFGSHLQYCHESSFQRLTSNFCRRHYASTHAKRVSVVNLLVSPSPGTDFL